MFDDLIQKKRKIKAYVATWHVVDGKWRYIGQNHYDDNSIEYYTDGKIENIPSKVKGILIK